jgi:hypothetical protein
MEKGMLRLAIRGYVAPNLPIFAEPASGGRGSGIREDEITRWHPRVSRCSAIRRKLHGLTLRQAAKDRSRCGRRLHHRSVMPAEDWQSMSGVF